MAAVVSIEERIAQSRRASAVARAWQVAKSLEGDRAQIEGLRWVEPEQVEGKGIRRRIDFSSEFPEGITYVTPVPMKLAVIAPASNLVPGEDIKVHWTMPLLTRMKAYDGSLDAQVKYAMSMHGESSPVRHVVDAVSFLPFPKADASPEETFNPEFMVAIEVDADLGKPDNYFAAVAKYNGKVIKQMVSGDAPKFVSVYADPLTHTHFSAQMLVTLSAEELASTPDNSGELEICLYRITQGGLSMKHLDLSKGIGDLYDLGDRRGSLTFGSDLLRGSGLLSSPERGSGFKGLSVIPGLPREPVVSPAEAPKEVGDVKLGEGARGEAVKYETLDGYVGDSGFGVQPIRIRFLGVREGSEKAALGALHEIAGRY
jgi:hypothetical protein